MSILLTGGAGYIGSHIAVELLTLGKEVVIYDNLSNSSEKVLDRIKEITGKNPKFYKGDLRDREGLDKVFKNEKIESVIHLAGLKAVGESVRKPIEYYDNNIGGTTILLETMRDNGVKKIIFSSSATVYGDNTNVPLKESYEVGKPSNPYGWSKWFIEQILQDLYVSDSSWHIVIFRYFNPVGAHPSGLIGEDPKGIPNNLTPYITQVAIGKLEKLGVFGDDYDTKDGTGVRDYIHIVDLAKGHIAGLSKLEDEGINVYNLGTGKGSSVLEVKDAYEKAVGKEIPYEIQARRPGDLDEAYCDASKAKEELGWEAEFDIDQAAVDAWNWQSKNPDGY
ncbi:UDP-glucose 4-epimerase GalE [uncultured Helcococcus sp.]|uniref:UDP-glucose 4-epimerase GalE n=1 Tax=uncultured Helcococcus sp. TaxID=1072508 RepID=UPI00288B8D0B|nr:UDP-glucose 4-epimerase GalE [uncultured Helcococcus sp.]